MRRPPIIGCTNIEDLTKREEKKNQWKKNNFDEKCCPPSPSQKLARRNIAGLPIPQTWWKSGLEFLNSRNKILSVDGQCTTASRGYPVEGHTCWNNHANHCSSSPSWPRNVFLGLNTNSYDVFGSCLVAIHCKHTALRTDDRNAVYNAFYRWVQQPGGRINYFPIL